MAWFDLVSQSPSSFLLLLPSSRVSAPPPPSFLIASSAFAVWAIDLFCSELAEVVRLATVEGYFVRTTQCGWEGNHSTLFALGPCHDPEDPSWVDLVAALLGVHHCPFGQLVALVRYRLGLGALVR